MIVNTDNFILQSVKAAPVGHAAPKTTTTRLLPTPGTSTTPAPVAKPPAAKSDLASSISALFENKESAGMGPGIGVGGFLGLRGGAMPKLPSFRVSTECMCKYLSLIFISDIYIFIGDFIFQLIGKWLDIRCVYVKVF